MLFRKQGISLLLAAMSLLPAANAVSEPGSLSLREALDGALQHYPSIRVSAEQRKAAAAGIKLARQVYLPRIDGAVQITRETSNNARQWLFPAGGPTLENIGSRNEKSSTTGWTAAVGTLVSWEPIDFGSRRAKVEAAQSVEQRAKYVVERTKLEVASNTADAFLTVLAAEGTEQAAKAAVERAEVLVKVVTAQVTASIRPGADESRARAELASANIQMSKAKQAVDTARAVLAQYTNGASSTLAPLSLPTLPTAPPAIVTDLAAHPAMQEQSAAVAEARARLKVAERSADPKFALEGGAFGYDSAFKSDGSNGTGTDGLGISTYNYGAGVTMNVPFGELLVLGDRKAQERARLSAAELQQDVLRLELTRQIGVLEANLTGTRAIAEQAPVLVKAATDSYAQALARYRAGLTEVIDVADTQRVLAQAEIDKALASLAVWQAWFSAAVLAPSAEDFLKGIPY